MSYFTCCCCWIRVNRWLIFFITMVIPLWAFMCGIFAATIFRSWLSLWFVAWLIRTAGIVGTSRSRMWSTFLVATTVAIFSTVWNNRSEWWIIFCINQVVNLRIICISRSIVIGIWFLCDCFLQIGLFCLFSPHKTKEVNLSNFSLMHIFSNNKFHNFRLFILLLDLLTLFLSVLLLVLDDDGTFVAAVWFVGVDFLAVSPAEFVFTCDFSLSLPLSFWTMFAYDDDVVVVDDTFLVVVSSLAAAEVADILSRLTVFFDRRFRLNLILCTVLSSNQCLGNKTSRTKHYRCTIQ